MKSCVGSGVMDYNREASVVLGLVFAVLVAPAATATR